MHHCVRGSGCSQYYLNYDATVYNSSLPKTASEALIICELLRYIQSYFDKSQDEWRFMGAIL